MLLSMLALAAMQDAPLEPSGKWVVDYGEAQCSVARSFAPGDAILGLRQRRLMRSEVELTVSVTTGVQRRERSSFAAEVLLPNSERIAVDVEPASSSGRHVRTATVSIDGIETLIAAGKFGFPLSRDEHVWMNVESLRQAHAALRKCSDDLAESLEIPIAELDAVAVPAVAVGTPDFALKELPRNLGRSWTASSVVLIEIDDQGNAAACRTIAYSGPEVLRDKACERSAELRFRPARNADGKAVRTWAMYDIENARETRSH